MIIFAAGPRKISKLNKIVKEKLDNIQLSNYLIILGDANGIDKAIQIYLHSKQYRNVNIYALNGKPRNNIGNWEIININPKRKTKDFEYYITKDIEMAKKADYGLMVWNGVSKGTLHNTMQLLSKNKKVAMYHTSRKKMYYLNTIHDLNILINEGNSELKATYHDLIPYVKKHKAEQLTFNNF